MYMKKRLILLIIGVSLLIGGDKSFAEWISPGELSKAHKELAGISNCLKCHPLTEGITDTQCRACHEKINKRIEENRGLHARVNAACVECHKDHKGEDYDITGLDREKFDHDMTGYRLQDRHIISCNKCHKEEETYLDISPECTNCHARVHKEMLPEDCIKCHNFKTWKDLEFDHIENSEFRLTGRHTDVKCELCHPEYSVEEKIGDTVKVYKVMKFKPLKYGACNDCHIDVHKGELKDKPCRNCHKTDGWEKTLFDHNDPLLSGFKLSGRHKKVSCGLCHRKEKRIFMENGKKKEKLFMKIKPLKHDSCTECHYDVHSGQFEEKKCDACHSLKNEWKDYTFRHESEKYRGFKLEGQHKGLDCNNCHERSEIRYMEFNREKKKFISSFGPVKSDGCRDCHYDIHRGQFKEEKCDACHSLNNKWKDYTFRHKSGKYMGFQLEGVHKGINCEKCHVRGEVEYTEFNRKKKTMILNFVRLKSEKCIDCHYDVHEGQFGKQRCEACHLLEDEWKIFTFRHESEAYEGFKLEGRHREIDCDKCHERSEMKYTEFDKEKKVFISKFEPLKPKGCADCHLDEHKERFIGIRNVRDITCGVCHSVEKDWEVILYRHKSEAKYKKYNLYYKAKKGECEKCHTCGTEIFCTSCCVRRCMPCNFKQKILKDESLDILPFMNDEP